MREARDAAGLSLAKIAGGEVTRAAIHRIEKGQIRPTRRTLELIAERTGRPIEFFLAEPARRAADVEARTEIDRLQELYAGEKFAQAADLGTGLLERLHDPARRATAALVTGSALVQEHERLDDAIALLEDARGHFLVAGDRWSAVEARDMVGLALSVRQDPRALPTLEEALAESQRLTPRRADLESRIYRHIGSHCLRVHEWQRAIEMYEQALEAAGPLRQLQALAQLYSGLAIAYDNLGDVSRAVAYSNRALAVLEMEQDRRSIARAENNLGMALMRNGQLEAAEVHLRRSLELSQEAGMEVGRAHVLLSMGELAVAREDLAAAEGYVRQAIGLAESLGERLTTAACLQMLARIAERRGEVAAADAAWRQAIEILTALDAKKRLMECHTRYSEVLEARGDAAGALYQSRMALALADPIVAGPSRAEDTESDWIAG